MATGIIFALIGTATIALIFRVLALPIAALLIAIAVYDLRHTLIPDAWVYLAAFAALAHSLSAVVLGFSENVPVVLIVGPVVSLPLFTIWLISRGAWMGFGDVKLALVMGWLLGLVPGLQALFLAFVLGALVSVPLLFFSSPAWSRIQTIITPTRTSSMQRLGFTMKSEVPFGPFLIAATFIVWISNMHGFSLFDVLL